MPDLIKQLSRGPNFVVKRFYGYILMDIDSMLGSGIQGKTQNSGVRLIASTTSFASSKDRNSIATYLTY